MTFNYKLPKLLLCFAFIIVTYNTKAQSKIDTDTVRAGLYDMGKMWTFDYPPVDYLKATYNFTPDNKWLDEVRLAALRFANYCSASFVSSDGLVMTNHHCARESGVGVQKKGEDFNENGFYAKNLKDERKVPGLYVDQLVKIEDITSTVLAAIEKDTAKSPETVTKVLLKIISDHKSKQDWKGLEIQNVKFYNGGKYALYGFKRYNDVRLVFMPELQLGFFGGDYDNFTYPRYALDCSFFRVYDEKGAPLKTSHFYKFNPKGANENEPVFVIGNPGRTKRLSTVKELEYRRDISLPLVLKYLHNRSLVLQQYNVKAQNDSVTNEIFSLENSFKAYTGELAGLNNPYLMARKAAFEAKFIGDLKMANTTGDKLLLWNKTESEINHAGKLFPAYFLLSGNEDISGKLLETGITLAKYANCIENKDSVGTANLKKTLASLKNIKDKEMEMGYLTVWMDEIQTSLGKEDSLVKFILAGQMPQVASQRLVNATRLGDPKVIDSLINLSSNAINTFNDPIYQIAQRMNRKYKTTEKTFKNIQDSLSEYRSQIGRLLFNTYGTTIPPDATFSLRINDGVVKGYGYNGTLAPSQTTFFGLYDRYYSFNKKFPWNLPKRWLNPSSSLLETPMNFVTTNDIIGGNSGSPMINKNKEVVGLVFDGNMESLPGSFIFLTESNRSVGVHSAGIIAALNHVYKAKRLVKELLK